MSRDDGGGGQRKPSLYFFEGCIPAEGKVETIDHRPFTPSEEVGREELAAFLAAHPEAAHRRDELGKTMLLRWAGLVGADALSVLVDAGADVNARDSQGNAPLHAAAWAGSEGGVDLLLAAGASAEVVDHDGFSPLHWAARNGHEGVVRRLLEAGADPCCQSAEGIEPLFFGALFGQVGSCRTLLDAGADPFAAASFDVTPFAAARHGGQGEVLELFLEATQDVFEAIVEEDTVRLRSILQAHPGRIHAHNELGWRPLHYAALEGTAEEVALLLDAGADPNDRDAGGMHVLQMTSRDEVARLLVERGADPKLVVGPWGTLLHLAIPRHSVARVRLYLEAGVDPRAMDPRGRCCLELARETGNEEMVELVEAWLEGRGSG